MSDRLGDMKRRLGYLARTGSSDRPREPSSLEAAPRVSLDGLGADWNQVGEHTYSREGTIPLERSENCDLSQFGFDTAASDLLFFDTETTGLSGGAGTLIFLIGMAWFVPEGVAYEQVFLTDFPGEPEFLERIDRRFSGDRLYVSYNGRTFDSHLLRTRHLMNALQLELPNQLDLLFAVRRFWRRILPDCRLGTVERTLLGIERSEDIPGALVPEAYFSFLRGEGIRDLLLVFEHNRQDIISLARLLDLLVGLLQGRSFEPVDRAALGEYLLAAGNQEGLCHLRRGFEEGDTRAGRILSLYFKRMSLWPQAIEIWKEMASRRSLFAVIELAKYWEHRLKEPEGALEWLEQATGGLPVPKARVEDLRKRKARLRSKIERQKGREA